MGIWYRVHTAATIPEFNLLARACCKVHVKVTLEGKRLYAVNLTVMSLNDVDFYVFTFLCRHWNKLLLGFFGLFTLSFYLGSFLLLVLESSF